MGLGGFTTNIDGSGCAKCAVLQKRIAELEGKLLKYKSVGWAIWKNGENRLVKELLYSSKIRAVEEIDYNEWNNKIMIPVELFRKEGE